MNWFIRDYGTTVFFLWNRNYRLGILTALPFSKGFNTCNQMQLLCNLYYRALMFYIQNSGNENIIINVWKKWRLYSFWTVSHMNLEYIKTHFLMLIFEVFLYHFDLCFIHIHSYFILSQLITHINQSCYVWFEPGTPR